MSRSSPPETLRHRLTGVAILVFCALTTACSKPQGPAPEHIYTVRGQVVAVPDPARPKSTLQIRHEPIPEYVNNKGEKVGMGSMTMRFPGAPGLDLSGIAPGDAVEFTWEVRWASPPFARVSKVTKLPPGTTLNFGSR